ncbi:MAG: MFS transporter [Phycisphaerales bacterium JB038]
MSLLPNLLASRRGRLTAFFFLYVAEGIPLGFTATAIVTQMRRAGIGPDQIGAFIAVLYLPWGWKWAIGPVVDLVYSDRLGRRRLWIAAAQFFMILSLLSIMRVQIDPEHLRLFFIAAICLNIFSATQDVAIDALACGTLRKEERGLANGLMFAGSYLGIMAGGAGILFLNDFLDDYFQNSFRLSFLFVIGAILSILLLVTLPLRETRQKEPTPRQGPVWLALLRELLHYLRSALRAFFGSRSAVAAMILSLLPIGSYSLSLVLQANLAVEIGMKDKEIALLGVITGLLSAGCCVLGGILSDRFGRRRMLALYILAMAIPPTILAYSMQAHYWILPIDPTDANHRVASAALVRTFWLVSMIYATFAGFAYGTRHAIFMDVCDPKVAATQFTAYMALLNVGISYSAFWQGHAIDKLGYPTTLDLDVMVGFLCLAVLPFVKPRPSAELPEDDVGGEDINVA